MVTKSASVDEPAVNSAGKQYRTLLQACRAAGLPKKPSPPTLWRWRTSGVLINGQRIRLECVKVGGSWLTTDEAFSEFMRQQTAAALAPFDAPEKPSRSPETQKRLAKAGLIQKARA